MIAGGLQKVATLMQKLSVLTGFEFALHSKM